MCALYGTGVELVWRRDKPALQLITVTINLLLYVSDIFSDLPKALFWEGLGVLDPPLPRCVFSYFTS